ncbi:6-carboxytetrahydropterin synthase QueD [Methanocaldococcus infernus]|uniref:6-pyruvoyl tetrahydropterin synthase n=1 Tax=Methanocaldococcus infernus (strain DSM 11812 / JCM 15783 / ME) TaxID=573063 RepID=D5VU31_METIM|nr:6-carboxytetrahydropterin synthase QueD [Methanocaldococcus infernus]ADG14084.1 6-pyruvoyl tetrahydropterin synthase [Methanocaldococcus infernus ME]
MRIKLDGLYSNLKFSSAHIIFGHETCGYIHGHSYYVDVELSGEKKGNFLCDFRIVKKIVKEICKRLDHKLLIPKFHKDLYYEIRDNKVYFKYKEKEYLIPVDDILLLPIPSTSAEDLAIYIADELYNRLKDHINLEYIEVSVNEGLGQKATYRKVVKE